MRTFLGFQSHVPAGLLQYCGPPLGAPTMWLLRFKGGFKFLQLSIKLDQNKLLVLSRVGSAQTNHEITFVFIYTRHSSIGNRTEQQTIFF